MSGSTRIIVLVFAVAVGLGLSLYVRQASAAPDGLTFTGSCAVACASECASGCRFSGGDGCSCVWICNDGTHGSSICL